MSTFVINLCRYGNTYLMTWLNHDNINTIPAILKCILNDSTKNTSSGYLLFDNELSYNDFKHNLLPLQIKLNNNLFKLIINVYE